MAEQQLIGALEAGGTKMVCATGYADGTVLEREQIATTTPQETVEAVNAWFADKGIAALGIGAFGPTAVNPASPQYGKILETPKTAWRYFDLLGTIQNELNIPCGYDTDVNKRGGRVSAGQRQLISFARAFLADPAVLILDEATASLDIPSERLIQDALQTLLADRTAIIIAHRLSTVAIADRVLVMEHGRIIEDDSPNNLIGGTGKFAQLHAAWLESLV